MNEDGKLCQRKLMIGKFFTTEHTEYTEDER